MRYRSRGRWGWSLVMILVLVACNGGVTVPTTPAPAVVAPTTAVPTATRAAEPTGESGAEDTPSPTGASPEPARPEGRTADDSPPGSSQEAAMRPGFVEDLEALGAVPRYSLEVTVDPSQALVTGRETVAYVNRDTLPQTEVYFRLFPNLPNYGGEMTVSNVRVGGEAVEAELSVERTALRVPLPEPLIPGEEATIELDFEVSVPQVVVGYGQFVLQQEIMALANFYPLIPAFDQENCALFGECDGGWNIEYTVPYGDAVFSETALYELRVTAPAGWTVVASGSTVGQETDGAGDVTWQVVTGPMRDVNLVLSPRFEVSSREVDGIAIHSYYLPEHEAAGEQVLEWTADSMAFFDARFGPYPFAELDVVETPTVAGGIEYPGLIVMPLRNYEQGSWFFEFAAIHEVAHQWWYSVVGNDQQDEPWVDEALAQYSTALYYESEEGSKRVVDEILREGYYQPMAGTERDQSFSKPVEAYTEATYGPLVYGKGPLFLDAVREEVGLETFYRILQTYYATYRYQVASGSDWLAIADGVAEEDLGPLYEEWVWEPAENP